MKSLKKVLKFFGWTLGVLVLLAAVGYFALDKKMPEGKAGPEAEALADKMLAAINKPAWDSLGALHWNYSRGHEFTWDKRRNLVEVKWKENRVLLKPEEGQGIAYKNSDRLEGKEAEGKVQDALKFFWNDGFWLYAPYKCKDPGTVRKLVETEEGQALLVTYMEGGLTPGDSYLWYLDQDGLPTRWQFWVKILPIGGLGSTWESWQDLPGGAKLATKRGTSLIDLVVTDLRGGANLAAIGIEEGLFDPLLQL